MKSRREDLAEKLRKIDAQIQAVTPEEATEPAAATVPDEQPARGRKRARRGALPALIVKLMEAAGEPLTIKQLSEEIRQRRFPTKSKNISRLVQTRVYDLVKKKVLAHASGQPGYVLRSAGAGQTRGPDKVGRKGKRGPKPAKAAAANRTKQPPLRQVLTGILAQAREPLSGGELAHKALASGYKSDSKSFPNVVSVSLANMDNIEHIAGAGYQLKR